MWTASKCPIRSAFLVIGALAFPWTAWGDVTPDELSTSLVNAFVQGAGIKSTRSSVKERTRVGVRVRTVSFAIGKRTYRIVFTPDGMVSISLIQQGDLAAQPLWRKSANQVTVEEIVNFVYGRELGQKYDPAQAGKKDQAKVDLEKEYLRKKAAARLGDGSALRWNNLMNQMARGDTAGLATSSSGGGGDAGFSAAASVSRSMDPCGSSSGGLSPQRAAITNVAQAIAAAASAGRAARMAALKEAQKGRPKDDAGFSDRSREYDKQGTYSVLEDLQRHKDVTKTEEMVRIIQDTGADTTDLFRKTLAESDRRAKDPYSVAAGKNFKTLIDRVGRKKSAAYVQAALTRVVVDFEAFTDRRRLTPHVPVIYDRKSDRYFVDPTFSSPSEARYLLSLAAWYEAEMERFELRKKLSNLVQLEKRISEMEHATLSERDEQRRTDRKLAAEQLARDLFTFADHVTKAPAHPK